MIRLLSLNVWGGSQGKKLLDYIKFQAEHTDIFCFQEVFDSPLKHNLADGTRVNLLRRLKKILPGHSAYFFPAAKNISLGGPVDFELYEGPAIFVKKDFSSRPAAKKRIIGKFNRKVEFKVGKENSVLLGAKVSLANRKFFWIFNFHGISRPGDKLDSPLRIEQSKKIVTVVKRFKGPKILCGDFNLMPKTQSIKLIEQIGLRNLISAYKIKNTRNSLSWKMFKKRQYFADFTFVSPDVKIKAFKVPYSLVSDHLPMILDFDV